MKVSTEIDNNFGYENITQLVDNIPIRVHLRLRLRLTTFSETVARIPEGQPMVYCPFSTANITPRIFLGSPRPLSTDGMDTATLSPMVQSFIITRLRLTTRSACFCCAAIASFLFLSMLLVGWVVSGRGGVVSDRGWGVSGRGWVVSGRG